MRTSQVIFFALLLAGCRTPEEPSFSPEKGTVATPRVPKHLLAAITEETALVATSTSPCGRTALTLPSGTVVSASMEMLRADGVSLAVTSLSHHPVRQAR